MSDHHFSLVVLVASTMSCRLDEVAAAFNLNTTEQYYGIVLTEYFPWDETRITALSNRYMNTRNDNVTEYSCRVNQVGVRACKTLLIYTTVMQLSLVHAQRERDR